MAQRGSARRCPTPRDRRPRVVAAQSCSPQSMRARRCPQTSTRARPGCAESRRRGCAVRGANRSRADGRERGVARERDALRAEAAEVQHHVARDENLLLQDVQPPHGSRLVDEHVIEHEHLGDVANPVIRVGARAEVDVTHGQRAGVHARALVHAIDEQPERVGRQVVGPGPHLPQPGQIIPAIDQVEPGRNHPLRNAAPAYLPHLVALVVRHHRHAVRRRRRRVQHRDHRVTRRAGEATRGRFEERAITLLPIFPAVPSPKTLWPHRTFTYDARPMTALLDASFQLQRRAGSLPASGGVSPARPRTDALAGQAGCLPYVERRLLLRTSEPRA